MAYGYEIKTKQGQGSSKCSKHKRFGYSLKRVPQGIFSFVTGGQEFIIEIKILYPNITFEYLDGKIGESERNDLKSDTIHSRFEILDL